MSYQAIVAKLENVRVHPNADRIQLATCLGYTVVVGLDAENDDEVLLFPDDGQLSEVYCKQNDLIRYTDPETGEVKGGYFDSKRRVRAQTFRGEKSEAYVASLNSLYFADYSRLSVGDRFSELNGIPICNKYVTPETLKAARLNQPKQAKLNAELKRLFPEHFDTDQLRHAQDEELLGLVTLTAKLHGTSARSGLVKISVVQPQSWLAKLIRLKPKSDHVWSSVFGTRRVIKGEATDKHTDYRAQCHRILQPNIRKGELWYYEIVGYEDTGAPIMQTVDCTKMGKEFVKKFGKSMTYKYGCLPEKCEIYVYRIMVENEDGETYELPWAVVKDRCLKAGVRHVPELSYCMTDDSTDVQHLKAVVEEFTEERDMAEPLDVSHVREGVCVRIDNLATGKMKIFKNKTFAFKVLEGIVKDAGGVDTEEAEG
jgi:hypothetical protein